MPGALQIDIGTVAAGQVADHLDGVVLRDVDGDVGPTAGGQLELIGRHVERDDIHRILGTRARNHAQPDRAAARDDHRVLEGDLRTFDSVQRTRQRLGERSVLRGDIAGHLVHQRLSRVHHVAGHRSRRPPLEAVQVVGLAHVVLAAFAESAFPARHDLLGHHSVADGDVPPLCGLVIELDDTAGELVARDDHGLGPGRAVLVAPELGRSVVALEVTGTDPDGFDPDEGLPRLTLRDCSVSLAPPSTAPSNAIRRPPDGESADAVPRKTPVPGAHRPRALNTATRAVNRSSCASHYCVQSLDR